ncbi:diadenylate cyclase [Paenibacillus sp. LBL]|uniref:sporulation-specific diadenylate cyclase CdaS n=1 Tax=Paenibacillus sp. LBL TaxID=2940563 RepID=UPI00247321EB|nr:sporulation-specific diadenylate cyclase CdaS [Paenibacillus sp. LBL]MDH6670763.1 diadenylate cyclase [Paenibacillus sp. LBL]
MQIHDCNFTPLKRKLKNQLIDIKKHIENVIANLDQNSSCLLNELDLVRTKFLESEAISSTYYLNCFLFPFTSKYQEIAKSIYHLSQKNLGALIVIQREDPLDSLITPGIPLSAEITSPLLESIFVPGSPLHDGAVLVRKEMIISAANVLPLTAKTYGDRKLGTRHRAAIGLSEISDALVLVVSEETGRTSFCMKGTLYPLSITSP